jgi:predicted DCC family thiol-disulfide oxidoreductase YuxK
MTPIHIEAFYDGNCPLCLREVRWLRLLDKRGRIRFTDIADPSFEASDVGVPWDELMASIHGRLPDGKIVKGVEVFRRLYAAVGFGPLVLLTRLPGISHLLDLAYRWFAKNRMRLTGRCSDGGCAAPAGAGKA